MPKTAVKISAADHLKQAGAKKNNFQNTPLTNPTQPAWLHFRCISESLRGLMQRLRDISKRADLQISETSPVRCIKDVSSEMSLRSLRSSERRLRVEFESFIRYFQTEAFFGYLLICLRVLKYFANLI